MPGVLGWRCWLAVAAALLAACPATARGQAGALNVDVEAGWGGAFRAGEWMPMQVTIRHDGPRPLEAELSISMRQDWATTGAVHQAVVVTPGVPRVVPMTAPGGQAGQEIEVRLTDPRGRVIWRAEYGQFADDSQSASGGRPVLLQPLEPADVLIGVVGAPPAALAALEAEDRPSDDADEVDLSAAAPAPADSSELAAGFDSLNRAVGAAVVRAKSPAMLPIDWAGYAALDVLVLRDTDIARLDAHQAAAIAQWVRACGGSLLLVLSQGGVSADSPVAQLLPFDAHALQPADIAVEAAFDELGPDLPMPLRNFLPRRQPADRRWLWRGRPPWFGCGLVGLGRVAVLGFDPEAVSAAEPAARRRLWRNCLNQVLQSRSLRQAGSRPWSTAGLYRSPRPRLVWAFMESGDPALNGIVCHLMSIRQLRPLSGWVVVGLLGALAVVIGPLDWFLLKRLDRQPWTHATMIVYLALFTAGAWLGVRNYRAGASEARAVTVTDAVQGEQSWSATYAGIFASQGGAYAFAPRRPDGWWRGLAPWGYPSLPARQSMTLQRIDCRQQDGGCRPDRLGIHVWTMQCLLGEGPGRPAPLRVSAEWVEGKLNALVENLGDVPAEQCRLFVGGTSVALEPIGPGQSRRVTGLDPRALPAGASISDYGKGQPPGASTRVNDFTWGRAEAADAMYATRCLSRTGSLGDHLQRGSVVVCARLSLPTMPFAIPGRQLEEHHVEFVRLISMPLGDRFASPGSGNGGMRDQ